MKNKKTLGNILLLITAVIWGTAFVGQRAGMGSIEPLTFNASRMFLSAVAVGGVAIFGILRKKRENAETPPEVRKKAVSSTLAGGICCGTFLATASIFQQTGLVYTTAGKAGFITAMYMLIVPVINFLLFRKRNTWLVWTAVLTGVFGMYLLCVTDSFSLTKGDALVSGCAILFSGHILCCDHFSKDADPIQMSAVQFVTATLISAFAAFLVEEPSWEKIVSAAIPILYCGILSGGVGYTLQIAAQKFTDPTVASLLMSLESVFAVIAGALLLNERMTGREIAGCVVMLGAIVLVQLPSPSQKKKGGVLPGKDES